VASEKRIYDNSSALGGGETPDRTSRPENRGKLVPRKLSRRKKGGEALNLHGGRGEREDVVCNLLNAF